MTQVPDRHRHGVGGATGNTRDLWKNPQRQKTRENVPQAANVGEREKAFVNDALRTTVKTKDKDSLAPVSCLVQLSLTMPQTATYAIYTIFISISDIEAYLV